MTAAPTIGPADVARLFVASAPVKMTLIDLDCRFVELSPPFLETFVASGGRSREEVIGRRVVDLRGEAARDLALIVKRLARGEAVVQTEWKETLPSGASKFIRTQSSYWRDSAGVPIAILSFHHDVTVEVEARAARIDSTRQLRDVLDKMPLQIALIDLDTGQIELLNTASRNGFAKLPGLAVGRKVADVLTPELRVRLEELVGRAQAAGGAFEEEREIRSADGVRIARMRHQMFDDAHGRWKMLWMATDITELRKSAEALKQAAAEAEAANRAKSEFLANMSHEIRTPLNGVMGVAGALARTELTPAQREMVALVETSAKTLETLLSDILDLARIEAGKLELRSEPFDLASSVSACTALFDAAAQAKGLDLVVEIDPAAVGAYVGDAARIRQILSNLLGNALKFTQVGHVALRVDAIRGETSSVLRFEVRDTGIGFDAEAKARLFSRFEQADGSITRRFGGSGLGLSISRSLAEAMDGRIEGDGEPGEGAVFTLTLELPRCEGALDLWCETLEPEPAPDPLMGMRVLLAEDHPTNRRVVELILGAAGVHLTCVENGVEAVDAFRRNVFDLILMDMQMPLMDGLSAIEEIRRIEAATGVQPTPIHVLTANAMPEHISASLEAGADGHLSKPILADALLDRVAQTAAGRSGAFSPLPRSVSL
jgi:PAS domain S-box-containing protein